MPTPSKENAVTHARGRQKPLNLVRAPKTGEVVADQIRRRIVRGELAEGDFLPSEAELIATLGVSRPTLREALRVLEAEQLISVGRGSRTGPRVHAPHVAGVARYAGFALQVEGATIADIYQARLSIEPYVAAHLAVTKPDKAAATLGAEIEQLAALIDAGNNQDFVIGVAHFHRVLVELSGNRTLLMITRMLQDIVARYQVRRLSTRPRGPDEQRQVAAKGLKSFYRLRNLIEAGDADGASKHWHRHLEASNAVWLSDGNGAEIIDVFG